MKTHHVAEKAEILKRIGSPHETYEAHIISEYQAGKSCSEIGKPFQVTKAGIAEQLKRSGVKLRPRGGPNGKRIPEHIIIAVLESDEPQRTIAKRLGIGRSTVMDIKNGKGRYGNYRNNPRK